MPQRRSNRKHSSCQYKYLQWTHIKAVLCFRSGYVAVGSRRGSLAQFYQKLRDFDLQDRQVALDNIPCELKIDAGVVVHQLVSHSGDGLPGNVWVSFCEANRDTFGGLAKFPDFE